MIIINISDSFYPPSGGKSVSRRALLKELARKHQVISFSLAAKDERLELDGIEINTIAWPQSNSVFNRFRIHHGLMTGQYLYQIINKALGGISPDLVFTDGTVAWIGTNLAKRMGAKSVFFNHDFDGLCPDRAHHRDPLGCGQNCFYCTRRPGIKLAFPLVHWYRNRYRQAVKDADLVIANSQYTRNVVRRFTGRDPEVSYPIIDPGCPGQYQTDSRGSILFVKPVRPKGSHLVLELARSLEKYKFTILGKSDDPVLGNIRALANVRWLERCDDMSWLYSQTRAVLVPSLLPETFGRVAVEAMACGAVPLVSNRGALPEAVAGAGVVLDPLDREAWKDTIAKLFHDQDYWQALSQKGLVQAQKYNSQNILTEFRQIVRQNLGVRL